MSVPLGRVAPKSMVELNSDVRASSADDLIGELPQWHYSVRGTLLGMSGMELKYQNFMSKKNSLMTHTVICVAATVINLVVALEAYNDDVSIEYKYYTYQRLIFLIPLWLHLFSVIQLKYPDLFVCRLPVDSTYLGDIWILTYSICFGVYLYGMATVSGCESDLVSPRLMCDHIPVAGIIAYVSVLLMSPVLFKSKHLSVVILSLLIEIVVLSIIVSIVEPTTQHVISLIIVFISQSLVIYDSNLYSRLTFLLLIETQSHMRAKMMSENENVVMEMQSKELRFLIGNVAHDLKTPLQAFSYELEKMEGRGADESIRLLESICSFMLMTINRAIDYTKVTSGIQLKPSMETVDMLGVLEWVKKCVAHTTATSSVPVLMEPLPEDMCQSIITDKQWLMENLLCLISNAQKFTAQGAIRVVYSFVSSSSSSSSCLLEGGGSGGSEVVNSSAGAAGHDVGLRTQSNQSMVMVEVIDDGIGISEEMQKKLFQPFKQAMRRAGGTGLGIYSMLKRVESLGGKCGVSSRSDGKNGAHFGSHYRIVLTTAYSMMVM